MAKRINRNKVAIKKRQMRTHSKINSPKSNTAKKGSATSTPSSVTKKTTANNGRRNNVTNTVNNANKALNRTKDNLLKPKQVTTNNPKRKVNKHVYKSAAKTGTLDQLRPKSPVSSNHPKSNVNKPEEALHIGHGFTYAAQAEVNRQLQEGTMSQTHGKRMNDLGQIMAKHLSSDEYATWYRNLEDTGELVLPSKVPTTLSAEEKEVWNYYAKYKLYYDRAIVEVEKAKQEQEDKAYHTADYKDYSLETTNSYFDIIRNYVRTFSEGDTIAADKNFIKDFKEYHQRYIFSPLKKGMFGVFANNILVNLGETMDMLATAPKALLKGGSTTVYGTGTRMWSDQNYWVYSGGKDVQKELVNLGAMDLLTYGEDRIVRGKSVHDPEKIKRRIKEAGLWDEYLKFSSEYSKADLGGSPIEELKHAYTSHDNYYADTGMLGFDLLTEFAVDPSFMIGSTAKSFTSAGTKALLRDSVKEGLEAAVKDGGPLLKELKIVLTESEKVAKDYYKIMNDNIFSVKTRDGILDTNIKNIANALENSGALRAEHKPIFINNTLEIIKNNLDSKHFKFIQGVHALDVAFDKFDSTALKTIFAAPYLTYKGVKGGRKLANRWRLYKAAARVTGNDPLGDFFYKRAASRVKEGLVDENGYLSIAYLEEALARVDNETALKRGINKAFFYNDLSDILINSYKKDAADLIKMKERLLQVDDLKQIDLSVNIFVTRITKGRFSNAEEFLKHLQRFQFMESGPEGSWIVPICEEYISELKMILNHRKAIINNKVVDYYRKLKTLKNEEDFISFYSEALSNRELLPDELLLGLESLKKDFNEESIAQIVREYEVKHNTTFNKAVSGIDSFKDIKKPYGKDDLIMKGELAEDVKRAINSLPKISFKSKIPGVSNIPIAYKSMFKYLRNVRKSSNMVDLRDFITRHQSFSAAYIHREAQGLVTKSERYFKTRLDKLATTFVSEELGTNITKDAQLVQMHVDKLAVTDRFLADPQLREALFNLFSTDTLLGKALKHLSENRREWKEIDDITDKLHFSKKCSELYTEVEVAKATVELRDRLATLPERERWAVLETLFGISKGSPRQYVHMNTFKRSEFIQRVNLWLNSNYGVSTVALDGFSKQAKDFDSDLYKNFKDEVQDPQVQYRIKKFLEGGHINPVKDVQKQMFQIILKDPESVAAYNSMAKRKDVLFTDIETQGLNSGLHEITSIATKKWVEIPEGTTLKEILDILEDSSTEVLHKASYTEEYLTKHVSDELLEAMFKHNDTIAPSRDARLKEYIKMYGVKEGEDIVSEQDMLTDFMVQLDSSYTLYNDVPTLVVHNNNGFDLNFIQARCIHYKNYPHAIPHLKHILDASENTIMRLKGLEDDVILSNESMNLIIESVEEFMGKIRNKNSFRLFDEAKINNGLKLLDETIGKNPHKAHVNGILNSLQTGAEEIVKVRELYSQVRKEIKEELAIFKNDIIVNPHRIRLQNLDESEWAKYLSEEEITRIIDDFQNVDSYNDLLLRRYFEKNYNYTPQQINNLMRTIKDLNDTAHSPLGYRILFDDVKVSKYFDYDNQVVLSEVEIKGMQSFTEEVARTVNRRLKANPYLEACFEDYKIIINYIKAYASDLKPWDEYSYLKYIKEPSSVNEAYVMAQYLWNRFSIAEDVESVIKIDTEDYNSLKAEERLRAKYRLIFGDNFNLNDIISEQAYALLTDYNKLYHKHIYNDIEQPYITQFMTDLVKDNLAFQAERIQFQYGLNTYEEVAAWNKASGYAGALDQVFVQNHKAYSSFIDSLDQYFKQYPDKVDTVLENAAREMNERRILMSCNILRNIIKSEKDLISHLVHHNQFLNIPLNGVDEYEKLVQELLNKLRTEYSLEKIVFTENDGFLHIGLSKDCVLEKVDDAFIFKGEETKYFAPEYTRIKASTENIFVLPYKADKTEEMFISELIEKYNAVEEHLYRLTEGKSAGSIGVLHTYSKQLEMYEMLPKSFINQCMTKAHTCDSKLWHGASFDFTNLGDSANCWKYSSINDIDPFIAIKENIEEFGNRVRSERFMLDALFNNHSDLTLKNLFGDLMTTEEKLSIINRMTDHTCVILEPAKTSSGYAVHEVAIDSVKALDLAEKANAIFIPYDDFNRLQDMFNEEKITAKELKIFTKYFACLKNSMLMFTGTWLRNYVDATIKTAGDTGSISETIRYQMVAATLIKDYQKVVKYFETTKGSAYMSLASIKREFNTIPGIQITFEQFEFLEGWFKSSISGGQSSLVKALLKNNKGSRNTALKPGYTKTFKQRKNTLAQADTVASEIERFQDLPYEEIKSLCDDLHPSSFRFHKLSKERFLEGFVNLDSLSDSEYLAWNNIANEIIQLRSKRLVHHSIFSIGARTIDSFFGAVMTPMSKVEEMVRLGEYLSLESQGYKRGDIFRKITETHFNYDLKTNREKILECFIPMLTYEKCNALYWVKQLEDNPRMLRYLEHFWGGLSWSNNEMSSEERMQNEYFRLILQSGNIPLGNSGLYLKSNPSFIAALDLVTGGPDTYISKLSLPLQFISKSILKEYGADACALLSELNLDQPFDTESLVQLIPVFGAIYDKFDKGLEYFDDEATYLKLKEYARYGWQGALIRVLPSVFGATTRWTEYTSVDRLEGESWDDYCRRVKIKKGLVWDNNQRKFVSPEDVISGMLNDPNLSWEETNYYNFILFGTIYDSNQKKWSNMEDLYISGGLNSNDNTWDELVILKYIMHGEMWDYNQSKWVKVTEPAIEIRPAYSGTTDVTELVRGDRESILSKLGLVSPVYADTLSKNALVKSNLPLKNKAGQYILTGDAEHDNRVFELMKAEVKLPVNNTSSYMRYYNGNAGGYKYTGVSYLPRPKAHSISKKYLGVVNTGGKAYSKTSNRTAGLRMAVSKYTAYDLYYNYDYSYSYNYRNTIKSVADYPQTKLGIDRYLRLRGDNLLQQFQNRNNADAGNSFSTTGLSVEQRLNKIKMHWWNK